MSDHDDNDRGPRPVFDGNGKLPTNLVSLVKALRREGRGGYVGRNENGEPCFAAIRESIAVLGGAGQGKTTGFYVPSVASYPGPVVVTSIRHDLRDATLKARQLVAKKFGGVVVEFDPYGDQLTVAGRLNWDPMHLTDNWQTARERGKLLADMQVKNDRDNHWSKKAGTLLSTLFYAGSLLDHDIKTVARNLNIGNLDEYRLALSLAARGQAPLPLVEGIESANQRVKAMSKALKESFSEEEQTSPSGYPLEPDAIAVFHSIFGEGMAGPEELSSIKSAASSVLDLYQGGRKSVPPILPPEGWKPSTFVDVDFVDLVSTCSTVYITVPDHEDEVRPVVTAFVNYLESTWKALAPHRDSDSVPGLFLALDEAANICPLPRLSRLMSAGGGDGIQTAPALQNIEQAEDAWGKELGRAILKGAVHKLVYGGMQDKPLSEEMAATSRSKPRYEQFIHVKDDMPMEPFTASVDRLRKERTQLERRVGELMTEDSLSSGVARVRAVVELFHARARDGVLVRSKYRNPKRGILSLLDELGALTEVRTDHRLAPPALPDEISNPPMGKIYRNSTYAESGFVDLIDYKRDPYWLPIMNRVERDLRRGPGDDDLGLDGGGLSLV